MRGSLTIYDGARLWVEGVEYLMSRPRLLLRCLPFACLTILACVWASVVLWLCAIPLRLVRVTCSLDFVLRATSVAALQASQWLWPSLSSGAFFETLDRRCPELSASLKAAPKVRGVLHRARALATDIFVGSGVIYVCVASAAFWAPVLLTCASFASTGATIAFPFAPVFVLSSVVAALASGAWILWTPVVKPLWKLVSALAEVSKPLAALAAFLVLSGRVQGHRISSVSRSIDFVGDEFHPSVGCVSVPTVDFCAKVAWTYVLTFVQSKQCLAQFDARSSSADWAKFCTDNRWALFGFGLPSWMATEFVHPLAGILLLDVNQAAAAVFLAEARGAARPDHGD